MAAAPRDRATRLALAALTRPVNLVAPGAGLLFALLADRWWLFPVALVLYAAMVLLSVRDPRFINRALGERTAAAPREPSPASALASAIADTEIAGLLRRIAESETKLAAQLAAAPESLKPVLAAVADQVRSATQLGASLARRAAELGTQLATMDPARAVAEARRRRERAANATEAGGKHEMLEAANALEESARFTQSLAALRQRTVAQLDHLAASLDVAVVRAVRIRVSADGEEDTARALSEALRVDVQTMEETLGLFDTSEGAAAPARGAKRDG